jgi:glycosyltransferase involved in cell wall biosynthesis
LSLLNVARELHIMTNEISALIAECERRMKEAETAEINRDSSRLVEIAIKETHRDSIETEKHETRGDSIETENTSSAISQYPGLNESQSVSASQSPDLNQSQSVSVSLCMIVRNEENNIQRALASIKPVVEEMIVVDTGSTDRTKDIAKELGAKVYDFAWTDSFADARNFALSKATGEWILILDADEMISPSDHDKLRKLIAKGSRIQGFKDSRHGESPKATSEKHSDPRTLGSSDPTSFDPRPLGPLAPASFAYLFTTRNYVEPTNIAGWIANDGRYSTEEAGTGWFPGEKVRLFPNDRRITFKDPVHERVEPSLESLGIAIKQCIIPIHHYGMLDEEKIRTKNEYYYDLGKKRLAEKGGEDFRAMYDLAVQASGIGRYQEAIEYLNKVISIRPDFSKAHESLGNVYFNLGQYENALSSYRKSLELNPSSRDAIVMSSQCEIMLGESNHPIRNLESLLKEDPTYEKALFLIAAAHFTIGEREKGMEHVKKLQDIRPGLIGYFKDFAQLLSAHNRTREAQLLLDAAEDIKNRLF